MRSIHCIEIIERCGDNDVRVVMRYPFDVLEDTYDNIKDLNDLDRRIHEIDDRHEREATKTRLYLILNRWHPAQFYRFAKMNWKWDADYYKNLIPGSKASGAED